MAEGAIDPSQIEAAQRFIDEDAGPRRHLTGAIGKITSALAVGMSLVFLYWAWASVTAQVLRLVFLGLALTLTFLIYPTHRSADRTTIPWHDWLLALGSIAVVAYPMWDFEEFIYRAALPNLRDQILGALTILLGVGSDPPDNRMDLACRCLGLPRLRLASALGCRRPGPTEAIGLTGWSGTCT